MADSQIAVTEGSGKNVDTRTNVAGDHRQVVVFGGPSITDAVAEVASVDPGATSTAYGAVVRLAGSASVQIVGSTGTIAIHVQSTGGTMGVRFSDEPIVTTYGKDGTTGRALRMNSDGAIKIYDIAAGTISTVSVVTGVTAVTDITNSIKVHILSTGGTLIIKPDPAGTFFTNGANTASIFTVSGSTSGGLTSGVTLVAPSASYSFKVFAYSIQTTGAVSMVPRFTNGGESATEFWRPLVTASGVTGVQGANLAVTPPGFIFATGTSTTLAIKNDTSSLIHYSVSYIKETT